VKIPFEHSEETSSEHNEETSSEHSEETSSEHSEETSMSSFSAEVSVLKHVICFKTWDILADAVQHCIDDKKAEYDMARDHRRDVEMREILATINVLVQMLIIIVNEETRISNIIDNF